MTKRSVQRVLGVGLLTSATLFALSARVHLQGSGNGQNDNRQDQRADRGDRDGDDDGARAGPGRPGGVRRPPGQFTTPTAIDDSVQQPLSPGLAAYPDFIAGEAVRSQLSPDGTTLAILTAGQNSLYKADGTVDVANSTQFVFLFNVAGANKTKPALMQVIQQAN